MSNLIEKLAESNDDLRKQQAADLAKWSKFKHTQHDLETFLSFNVAEIEFFTKNGEKRNIVCTNNVPLIKILQTAEPEKKKKFIGHSNATVHDLFKNKKFVGAWDLIANKYKNIYLSNWQILNFMSISKENILLLDELIRNILGRS